MMNEYIRRFSPNTGGELPAGWTSIRNAALFRERSEKAGLDVPPLSVSKNTGVTLQTYAEDEIERGALDKTSYKRVEPGDIVYNRMRLWQGAIGLSKYAGGVSPAYVICTPVVPCSPEFLEFAYRSSPYISLFARHSRGLCDDQNRLNYDDFRCLFTLLPPIEAQVRIVEELRKEIASSEALTSALSRVSDLTRQRRASLIANRVVGGLSPDKGRSQR